MKKLHIKLLTLALLSIVFISKSVAQERKVISGYVYSAENTTPIEGVKVSTKHRDMKSVSTEADGSFTISINEASEINSFLLIFSYPGYDSKEQYVDLNGSNLIYMTKIGEYSIDKSVYYPYSNRKYTNMTSAAEPVSISYATQLMSSSFAELLGNSTAKITSASGAPGEGNVITIRGYSTIFADEKPLIVVDGQVIGNYQFSETTIEGFYQDPSINIDPRNIEAITILKDAPAAAIYGAKASNGVILIKTKSAKVGETEFDISGYYGANYMNKRIPVISNSDYFKPYLLEQMYGNGHFLFPDYFVENKTFNQYYKYNNQTDWQDLIYDYGTTAGANISVRGGDAIAKYFISGGYLHDEGSVSNTVYNRFNVRFNAEMEMTEWLVAEANMALTYSNSELRQQGINYANPVLNSLIKAPFLNPYIIDSTNTPLPLTEDSDALGISNPYELINSTNASMSSYNFLGTLNFKIKLTDKLNANVRGSSELNKLNEVLFLPNYGFYNNDYPNYNQIKKGISNFRRTSLEFNLRYENTFNEVHNLSVIAGTRMNNDEIIQDIAGGIGTPSDEFMDLGTCREEGRTKSGYEVFRNEITNFIASSYNYKEEYFADLTLAADVSSNIGNEVEPQIFGVPVALSPALGLGWNLTKRAGLSYSTAINYLKFRLSAGQLANVVYDPYLSSNFYTPVQYYTATGFAKLKLENDALRWERTNKINFGIDMGMLKQRLFLTAEVYYHQTMGVLNNTSRSIELGSEYWNNSGNLNTIGLELTAKYRAYDGEAFNWNMELSFGHYITRVSDMEKELIFDFGYGQKIFKNDESAGAFYGYKVMGVIASEDEANNLNLYTPSGSKFNAGDIHFNDINGDNIIDDADKKVIGNPAPDAYGSWVNIISYQQFTLLADISFTIGNDLYNHTRRELESMSGFYNQTTATQRRWQVDGQITDIPASAWGDPMGNSRFSDRWIENGSYVRLKRITLSFDLSKLVNSTNKTEVYITGVNLITIDNYLGYDPEFAYGSSILYQGIDYCKFPQNRSIMIGVKFGL